VDLFSRSLGELLDAVGQLTDDDFAQPSGCAGWLVRDLVCHFVIDAQDVLITLVTPSSEEPTHDAVTYWKVAHEPADDPLSALIVRLAAAYGEPWMLKFHVDDVGQAALRAGQLADPTLKVGTQDMVLCTSGSGRCTTWTWSRTCRTPAGPVPSRWPGAGRSSNRSPVPSPPRGRTRTCCWWERDGAPRPRRSAPNWAS
jgi:hypothetical protein